MGYLDTSTAWKWKRSSINFHDVCKEPPKSVRMHGNVNNSTLRSSDRRCTDRWARSSGGQRRWVERAVMNASRRPIRRARRLGLAEPAATVATLVSLPQPHDKFMKQFAANRPSTSSPRAAGACDRQRVNCAQRNIAGRCDYY